MHEVSLQKCGLIMQSLCQVGTETVQLLVYDGLPELYEFLVEFEDKVSEPQWLMALDKALKATPTCWWVTYKKSITGWSQCHRLMPVCFGDVEVYHTERYDGRSNPGNHLIECQTLWASRPNDEWVHVFIHMLDEMSQSWYVSFDLHREITT